METRESSIEEFAGLLGVLASDPPPGVAVRALVEGFLTPFAVERASLHVLSSDGSTLRLVGDYGYPPGFIARYASIDVTIDLPATHALRGTRPLVLTPGQLPERYPLLRAEDGVGESEDFGNDGSEWVFVPVQLDGRPSAVFLFLARAGVLTDHRNLVALQGVCHALTLWLHRARSTWPSDGVAPGLGGSTPLAFTERQRAILALVAQGLSNADIATALDCSRSTVKQELQRVMFGLAVSSRDAAVARASELGLLDEGEQVTK